MHPGIITIIALNPILMKLILFSVFICLPFLPFGQIAFKNVPSPKDFNIGAVKKSPIGEFFVQAAEDWNSIYTSVNGVDWTRTYLPIENELYDIQFFEDGTPLLKPEDDPHLIRRNGVWYTMSVGGGNLVEASFIREDTLFMYHDDRFEYSLDKGQTFTTAFVYNGNLVDHRKHLWKFDNHYVLHHTAGTQNRLSVFNLNGDRVLSDTLDIHFEETITYNGCGQVLFNDEDKYFLLEEDGLTYTTGQIADIISQFHDDTDLLSAGGSYYTREENTIYKTNGCNFQWQFYAANNLVESKEHIWFNQLGEIFLYDTYADYFTVQTNGTAVEHYPDIHSPYVKVVDESGIDFQVSLTTNAVFGKHSGDDEWIELDSNGNGVTQVQYSSRGDLYISRENELLYSIDNGQSFSTLPLPDPEFPLRNYFLEVLDDSILFLMPQLFGNGYYTLNNGQDWIDSGVSFFSETPRVKLIGNDIVVAAIDYEFVFTKINVISNEITSVSFSNIPSFWGSQTAILDDGTFYIQVELFNGEFNHRYYRYRFDEELKYLGPFPELGYATIASSGNNLYAFDVQDYYLLNGEAFDQYTYSSLPFSPSKEFIVSENQYLYVIVDQNSIYRSTQPLSIPTSTYEASAFVDFNISPNPGHHEITWMLGEGSLAGIDSYKIIDQLGRIVDQSLNLSKRSINITHLSPGLYYLVLSEKEVAVGIKTFIKY